MHTAPPVKIFAPSTHLLSLYFFPSSPRATKTSCSFLIPFFPTRLAPLLSSLIDSPRCCLSFSIAAYRCRLFFFLVCCFLCWYLAFLDTCLSLEHCWDGVPRLATCSLVYSAQLPILLCFTGAKKEELTHGKPSKGKLNKCFFEVDRYWTSWHGGVRCTTDFAIEVDFG